ncbi:hypothetical protein NE237_003046 [Protea cynaroides]|uniref:Uncharacterized protein n=1 Tax=Protea cynaroides TaxID=273540 RepID=A0A9Q0KG79_9MAGN|nr:hypothetical protein NE237_003046 [Protea cynaroides]
MSYSINTTVGASSAPSSHQLSAVLLMVGYIFYGWAIPRFKNHSPLQVGKNPTDPFDESVVLKQSPSLVQKNPFDLSVVNKATFLVLGLFEAMAGSISSLRSLCFFIPCRDTTIGSFKPQN